MSAAPPLTAGAEADAVRGLLSLRMGALQLDLAPEAGGSIARFFSHAPGGLRHWLRPASDQAVQTRLPLRMGSFPLVPYCNRIRHGRSAFGPLPIELPPNYRDTPHPLHGTAWLRPWRIEAHEAEVGGVARAVLSHRHEPTAPRGDWPYAFDATQTFELSATGLRVTLAVTNRSEHPMPTGIGQHPYFPRTPGARLTTHVEGVWEGDAEVMPTRLAHPQWLSGFDAGLPVQAVVLDNNFTSWSRTARVDWPETGDALEMRAEAPFDYFVVYSPPPGTDDGELFCMEPVSNCTDWMNLAAAGVEGVGGTLLPPGQTLSGRFELRPLPGQAASPPGA